MQMNPGGSGGGGPQRRGRRGGSRSQPYQRPSRGGRGGRQGQNGGGSGNHQGGGGGPVTVLWCSGIPNGAQFKDLAQAINTSSHPFKFSRINMKADKGGAEVLVNSQNSANALRTQIMLGDRTLRLVVSRDQSSALGGRGGAGGDSKSSFDKKLSGQGRKNLQGWVEQCYNTDNKFLDLSNAAAACGAIANFNNRSFVNEICSIIRKGCPDVITINLSNNNISSLKLFRSLADAAPKLLNLAFENNNINSLNELAHLSEYKRTLKELILRNNPCSQINAQIYHSTIARKFPALKVLDGDAVVPIISFDLPGQVQAVNLPSPQPSYFDNTKDTVVKFVEKFLTMYENPSSLVDVYAKNSFFSFSTSTQMKYGLLPAAYTKITRNLNKLVEDDEKAAGKNKALHGMVKVGPAYITVALDQLPKVQHDVKSIVADSFLVPSKLGGPPIISLTLHGRFLEVESKYIRSFHRCMLLGPPTAAAEAAGWPVSILNDHLALVGEKGKKMRADLSSGQDQMPGQQQTVSSSSSQDGNNQGQLSSDEMNQMAHELGQACGVPMDIAGQMLVECEWNYNQAGNRLMELKQTGQL